MEILIFHFPQDAIEEEERENYRKEMGEKDE
jgi:hypothetical protein